MEISAANPLGSSAPPNQTLTANFTAQSSFSSMLTVNWTVPNDLTTAMSNIKIVSATFNSNIVDEFGNQLKNYSTSVTAENGTLRPIDSANQMNRPDIVILPYRPRVTSVSTANTPASDGSDFLSLPLSDHEDENANGTLIGTNRYITLAFNAPVAGVPGKKITIRPYGRWAIPPVLSVDEFNSVYNADFQVVNGVAVDADLFQRWLRDVDNNQIPITPNSYTDEFNSYLRNTHGLTQGSAGNVRPDASTKFVLQFTNDLYCNNDAYSCNLTGAANTKCNTCKLRDVFNAAHWKWQTIDAASGNVTLITPANGRSNTVRIAIPNQLQDGRIWEVLIEDGAFQDGAANPSEALAAGDYRFWSPKTAQPVIRVERVSYDANNFRQQNVDLGFVTTANAPQRPPVDTRVRIDCETPGASIRYDSIRTALRPAVANGTTTPFTGTQNNLTQAPYNTDDNFFGTGITFPTNDEAPRANVDINTGARRPNLGNQEATNFKDTEGFNTLLLVPNSVTNTSNTAFSPAITLSNGTFQLNSLTTLGNSLRTNFEGILTTNQRQYRTVANSSDTFNTTANSRFFYIGEAIGTNGNNGGTTGIGRLNTGPATVNADTNAGLYSSRRDYIVAVARKPAITTYTGARSIFIGPALDVSEVGMEGVFKTSLQYRDPRQNNTTIRRLLVQGFDQPTVPVVAGFPLRDADSTNSSADTFNNYFSKSAYRIGGAGFGTAPTAPAANTVGTNHYMWVTWEIVTDWYQKGKAYNAAGNSNYLDNGNISNANSIAATYGSIVYKYQQYFYNP